MTICPNTNSYAIIFNTQIYLYAMLTNLCVLHYIIVLHYFILYSWYAIIYTKYNG